MICLIAGSRVHAERWAKSQNLHFDEWFHPKNVFEIYAKKNFHTILVHDGIDHFTNEELNKMLKAAWECGRRR